MNDEREQILKANESLQSNFVKAIGDPVIEIAEGVFDSLTDFSEIIDSIPLLNTAFSAVKIGNAISALRFTRNIAAFVQAVNSTNAASEEFKEFKTKMTENLRFRSKVATFLLESINDLKNQNQSVILAKLFVGYLNKQLENWDLFCELSFAMQKLNPYGYVELVKQVSSGKSKGWDIKCEAELIGAGLATRYGDGLRTNQLGKQLFEIGFNVTVKF